MPSPAPVGEFHGVPDIVARRSDELSPHMMGLIEDPPGVMIDWYIQPT
jgi:hypothetical protein